VSNLLSIIVSLLYAACCRHACQDVLTGIWKPVSLFGNSHYVLFHSPKNAVNIVSKTYVARVGKERLDAREAI
jgi:hypothetical protein